MKVISDNGEYYSCGHIESGLMFNRSTINFCCSPHSGNKGSPLICSYNGGDIPIETILAAREKLKRDNQIEGIDTPCKGCSALKKHAWPKKEKLFNYIGVGTYFICNLKCNYCVSATWPSTTRKEEAHQPYDMAQVLRTMLEKGWLEARSVINMGGGEPSLYHEFNEIISLILEYDLVIHLTTNCTVYSDLLADNIEKGNATIQCSVDAGTQQKYLEVKGRDYFYDVWNNLEKYAKRNSDAITVKYILSEYNCSKEEIREFVRVCSSRGIKKIDLSQNFNTHRGNTSINQDELPKTLVDSMALVVYESMKYDINCRIGEEIFDLHDRHRIFLSLLQLLLSDSSVISKNTNNISSIYSSFFDEMDSIIITKDDPILNNGNGQKKPSFLFRFFRYAWRKLKKTGWNS